MSLTTELSPEFSSCDTAPHESGDFLSQAPKTVSVDEYGDTKLYRQRYTLDDGTVYNVTSTEIPRKRREQLGNVAITETAAWLTHDKGLNLNRMLSSARRGFETSFVSPQQNISKIGHLTEGAHNQLIIAGATAEQFDRDPNKVIVQGISRAAMYGFGVVDLAPDHGIDVVYADLVVPCFPKRYNPLIDNYKYMKFPLSETLSLCELAMLPASILTKLPRTVSFSPKMFFQHYKEGLTMLSGATGKHAATMPHDTYAHVVVYKGDVMSQGDRWKKILSDNPNVTLETIDNGAHLNCAGSDCYTSWRRRQEDLANAIRDDNSVLELSPAELKARVDTYAAAA